MDEDDLRQYMPSSFGGGAGGFDQDAQIEKKNSDFLQTEGLTATTIATRTQMTMMSIRQAMRLSSKRTSDQ